MSPSPARVLALLLVPSAALANPHIVGTDHSWKPFTEGTDGWSRDGANLVQFHYGPAGFLPGPVPPPPYEGYPIRVEADLDPGESIWVQVCEGTVPCPGVEVHSEPGWADIQHFFTTPVSFSASDLTTGATYTDPVTLSWVQGHQQELFAGAELGDLAQAECTDDGSYAVYMNGQRAEITWCAADASCRAWRGPADPTLSCDGSGTDQGVYFPMQDIFTLIDEDHYLWRTMYPDVSFALGEVAPANAFDLWQDEILPYHGLFFDPPSHAEDLTVRPLLVELVSLDKAGEEHIVDRRRVMYYDDRDDLYRWFGDLQQVPGASALLTPSGLAELAGVHAEVLPYPSGELFDQRLSDAALLLGWQEGALLAEYELSAEDDYWTEIPPEGAEWAGQEAYADIFDEALGMHGDYKWALAQCGLDAQCMAAVSATHCVRMRPVAKDFTVVVDGIDARFDHGYTLPLVAGGVGALTLSFYDDGTTEGIASELQIEGLHGELEADLQPHTRIVYEPTACAPGTPRPDDVHLSDYDRGEDPQSWLDCSSMDIDATADAALEFPVDNVAEHLVVSPGTGTFGLVPAVDASEGGTCAEDWLIDGVTAALEATLETPMVLIVEDSWLQTPSQEEALQRLLTPLDIGVESVPDVPVDTLPYDVYPWPWSDLAAPIRATTYDTYRFDIDPIDGLYAPYLTRAVPVTPIVGWTWPCLKTSPAASRTCDAPWVHSDPFQGGVDDLGDPYDIALEVRPEMINQLLWAQSTHEELLGHATAPRVLPLAPTALHDAAAALPLADALLDQYPAGIEVRTYASVTPYVWMPELPPSDYKLMLLAPQVVIELHSEGVLVARLLTDVYDRDLLLNWGATEDDTLRPGFSARGDTLTTVTLPPGCDGTLHNQLAASDTCEAQLHTVLRDVVLPYVDDALLEMLEAVPAPKNWDQVGEATTLRTVTNRRYALSDLGIVYFGDLR